MEKRHLRPALAALVACVLGIVLLAGCASTPSSTESQETKQVTDAYGRVVEVPADVDAVATVGSGARFVVYAGGQDKLVAVTDMETSPAMSRPYTIVYQDLFTSLPSTSNGNHLLETTVNTEELVKLAPDVIVSSRSAEECDQLQQETGIPVIGISYQNQLFTDNVYNSILCVGEAIGTEDHAQQVVDTMKGWQEDIKSRVADIDDADKPSVYVGAVNYKGAKSFGGTYAHYAPLDVLGAVNVADQTGQDGSFDIDLEQLGAWDPDYMFLNMGNASLLQQDYADNKTFFDGLTAFKEGHLYSQPSYNFNGTNVEMGICDTYFIGATIYPERFADVDLAAKYREIFQTMLGDGSFYDTMQSSGMDFTSVSFS